MSKTAVTFIPTTPLQILAGPGSGKTRTLTCRIAHLIKHHKIPPSKIVAVTFTNKVCVDVLLPKLTNVYETRLPMNSASVWRISSARQMPLQSSSVLDDNIPMRTSLTHVIGTFHAICVKLLRQFGTSIKLPRNFSICDADEASVLLLKIR